MKPIDRIREAFAARETDGGSRRQRSLAAAYKPNAMYDRLLAMDPDTRPQLDPTTRIALATYAEARRAYLAEQATQE